MTISNLAKGYESREQRQSLGPSLTFLAAIAATAAVAGMAAQAMHWDYVLPLISTALFVLAAIATVFGWRQRRARQQASPTYWDVAGALTLIGICAAALVEPEQMVRVMASAHTP